MFSLKIYEIFRSFISETQKSMLIVILLSF